MKIALMKCNEIVVSHSFLMLYEWMYDSMYESKCKETIKTIFETFTAFGHIQAQIVSGK